MEVFSAALQTEGSEGSRSEVITDINGEPGDDETPPDNLSPTAVVQVRLTFIA